MDPATNLLLTALAAASSQMLQHHNELRQAMLVNKTQQLASRFSTCFPTKRNIYSYATETLRGDFLNLDEFRGRVILIVNTATYCEYTRQYRDLNAMLEHFPPGSIAVLAFPCNQFHWAEPGDGEEIEQALRHVRPGNGWEPHPDLRLMAKIEVNGDAQHPIYSFLESQCPQTVTELAPRNDLAYNHVKITDVTWNFEKFLIDKMGRPRFRFHPTAWLGGKLVKPYVEQLLAEADFLE